MTAGETIAVFGGSFDPPHIAHVLVAAYVLSACDVDRVFAVPAHRHSLDKETRASFEDRVAMTQLAMADLPRVSVSDIEGVLGGKSRTLVTLEALSQRMPDARFRLVIGADILLETDRWYRFDRVREMAPLIVVGRAGYERPEPAEPAEPADLADRADLERLEPLDLPRVSSTEIRARFAEGRSVHGLVPRSVEAYARAHGLYLGDGASA